MWQYAFVQTLSVVVVCSCGKVDFAFCDLTPGRNSARVRIEESPVSSAQESGVFPLLIIKDDSKMN